MTGENVASVSGNKLGNLVRRLREDQDLSQNDLAEKSGLKRSDIDSIERGTSKNPSAQKLAQIASGLRIPLFKLLEASGVPGKYLPKENGRRETLSVLLDRLTVEAPNPIPVYQELPLLARDVDVEPHDYIYSSKSKFNIEAFYAPYNLQPEIKEGDIIMVARNLEIEEGDLVACLHQNKLTIGWARRVKNKLLIENNEGNVDIENCEAKGCIIELRRRYKY